MALHALLLHIAFCLVLAGLSAVLTRLLVTRGWMLDHPNTRSSHTAAVPRAGGIAIALTFLAGLAVYAAVSGESHVNDGFFQGFAAAVVAIFVVSVADDLLTVNFTTKLGTQVAATVVVLVTGTVLWRVPVPGLGPVSLGLAGPVLTGLWIVGLTNAFNFMDGLDGLAAGQAVVAAAAFLLVTSLQGSDFVYLMSYMLLAGAAGFLVYNFPPARIFMGDSGSQFLGFTFALLAVIAARYDHAQTSFLVMPLLFLSFIWDTALTFARRLWRGERVTEGHRDHLYQRLNRSGWSHRAVTLLHLAVAAAQGAGALILVHIPGNARLLVFVPFLVWQAGYTLWVDRRLRRAAVDAAS